MSDQQMADLDLRQAERMRKLSHRLHRDLTRYDQLTSAIAEAESRHDMERVGLIEADEARDVALVKLVKQRTQIILAIKSAVWSTSNSLKNDHDEGKVVRARKTEQEELLEEEAIDG